MWINYFYIVDSDDENPIEYGSATLFDSDLMIVEINTDASEEQPPTKYITTIAGGQDGMVNWLKKNDYRLQWKAIKKMDAPRGKDLTALKMALNMTMQEKSYDLEDGRVVRQRQLYPWSINDTGNLSMSRKLGTLQPDTKTYVLVVDGSVAAWMPMEAFKDPRYGITDYDGGGHNFWIPFMMSGGRSGSGYIMTTDVSPLQASILTLALKEKRDAPVGFSHEKREEIMDYVFSDGGLKPLPEFEDRLKWVGDRTQELMNEGDSAETAHGQAWKEAERKIRSKSSDVFNNDFTLDGGYVVEGREYEWPKP